MTEPIYIIARGTDDHIETLHDGYPTLNKAKKKLKNLLLGGRINDDEMMGEDRDGLFHTIIKVDDPEKVTVH